MQAFEARTPPLVTGPDGVVRVRGTRVSLESIVAAFDAGATAEEIVQQYPSLHLAAVYAVISYVLVDRKAVDQYVTSRQDVTAAVRTQVEAQCSPGGIRERLLARRGPAGD
jgi:uncharacterized protein (DUF433 family)